MAYFYTMKHSLFIFSILLVLTTISCKKKGCTDEDATNYDVDAKKYDGSCTYTGDISFWFNEDRSMDLLGSSVTIMTVYIDDVSHGTIDPAVWAVGPECAGANTFTTTIDMGNSSTKGIDYSINDQTGGTRFSGFLYVTANDCESKQLN
jgi:hypothetical protein